MPTTEARTLRRAAEIVGGSEALAQRLGVSPLKLQDWLEGQSLPPTAVFLQAVDIVMDWGSGRRSAGDRKADE